MEERHEERRLTTADMARASSERRQDSAAPASATAAESAKPATSSGGPAHEPGTMVAERRDGARTANGDTARTEKAALFPGNEGTRFHERWDGIQAGFVDEPRRAVEQADALVAEVMQRLAQLFADERGRLEGQWSRGNDISTEDLRQALRRYRGFFDRLLSM